MNIAKKIREQSKELLNGQWAQALMALFVLLLFVFVDFAVFVLTNYFALIFELNETLSVSLTLTALVISVIFTSPAINGYLKFHYNLSLSREADVNSLFAFFKKGRYFKTVAFNLSVFFRSLLPLQLLGICLFAVLFITTKSNLTKTFFALMIAFVMLYILIELVRLSVVAFLYIDNPDNSIGCYFTVAKAINKYHYHNNIALTFSFMPWIALCYFILTGFYVIPYFTTSLATSAKWLIKLYKDGKIL